MDDWGNWVAVLWPIASGLTPIMLGAGFLWLRTKFASSTDLENHKTASERAIDQVNLRITSLDAEVIKVVGAVTRLSEQADSAPTRLDLLEKLSSASERMSRIEAQNESLQRLIQQLSHGLDGKIATLNQYLHTLVEQSMDKGHS